MTPFLWEKNNSSDTRFLLRSHGGQKEVAHLSSAERKIPPTQNPVKTAFENEGESKTFLDEGKLGKFVASRLTLNG